MIPTFKKLLNNHLTHFMKSYHDEPKIFLSIARDVKIRGMILKEKENPYDEAAIDIVNAMAKETFIIDLFTQAIADNNMEEIKPGIFLEKADHAPEIQPEDSSEIIETVAYTIEEMEKAGESFPAIYFENYFGEYITSIFFVSGIESFYLQKELFQQLQDTLNDKNQSEELFAAFMSESEILKEDLSTVYLFNQI